MCFFCGDRATDSSNRPLFAPRSSLKAQPTLVFQNDNVVLLTAQFLNDSVPKTERLSNYADLVDFVAKSGCLDEWKALFGMNPLDPATRPDLALARLALEMADRFYLYFLAEDVPFCTSMSCAVATRLGLPIDQIRRLGRYYRTNNNLAQLY
jgi:hypothetical protein